MLYEEIQNEKSKIINEMVLSAADEDTEISFSATAKIRGLQATEIGTFVVSQRLGDASFARGHGLITSKDGESVSYFGSGTGKIQGGRVRWPGAIYNHTKEHMRRWQ
ncbi:MAG TPA: hypothetical protein VE544_11060 [Nitrososphaeraceae archaeon]|jgi:hypothetical protein|nr:hypothetical protein [Nitrososphaeraceae archaeon]